MTRRISVGSTSSGKMFSTTWTTLSTDARLDRRFFLGGAGIEAIGGGILAGLEVEVSPVTKEMKPKGARMNGTRPRPAARALPRCSSRGPLVAGGPWAGGRNHDLLCWRAGSTRHTNGVQWAPGRRHRGPGHAAGALALLPFRPGPARRPRLVQTSGGGLAGACSSASSGGLGRGYCPGIHQKVADLAARPAGGWL